MKSMIVLIQIVCISLSGFYLPQLCSAECRDVSRLVWYELKRPPNAHPLTILAARHNGEATVLSVISWDKFYTSNDSGKTWVREQGLTDGIVASSNPDFIYSYETNGRIVRSRDAGDRWEKLWPKIEGISEQDTAFGVSGSRSYGLEFEISAIDPDDPLTLYATVRVVPPRGHTADFREHYFLRGTYVSHDGGENWARFSEQVGIFDKYPKRVTLGVDPANRDIIFGQGEHGILRSRNGGKTWGEVGQSEFLNLEPLDTEDRAAGILFPKKQVPLIATQFVFDPTSPHIVYVVSKKGVHRSLDGGDTWVLLNLGFDRLNAVNSFAVDPLTSNRVFAGTDRGLFVSEDRGCTFTKVSTPER